jgi:hypothetical protein
VEGGVHAGDGGAGAVVSAVVWTLADAVVLLREVQAAVEPLGFHTGILGSVVLDGSSKNDLDIVIYPACVPGEAEQEEDGSWAFEPAKPHHRAGRVGPALVALGMRMTHSAPEVWRVWRKKESNDTKHVEKWEYRGKTVDVFFLS